MCFPIGNLCSRWNNLCGRITLIHALHLLLFLGCYRAFHALSVGTKTKLQSHSSRKLYSSCKRLLPQHTSVSSECKHRYLSRITKQLHVLQIKCKKYMYRKITKSQPGILKSKRTWEEEEKDDKGGSISRTVWTKIISEPWCHVLLIHTAE